MSWSSLSSVPPMLSPKGKHFVLLMVTISVFCVTWKFSRIEGHLQEVLLTIRGTRSQPEPIKSLELSTDARHLKITIVQSKGSWTGLPGLVERAGNGTVFHYINRNISNGTGRPLVLLDTYKNRFSWPPQDFVTLNQDTDVSRGHVIVTGCSSNHYKEMLDTLSSIQHFSPGVRVIFYDLGLNNPNLVNNIKSLCDVEYRMFDFSAYPPHVKYLQNYSFKPLLLAEVMKEHPKIIWMDSSIRFISTGNFSHIKPQLLQTGGVLGMLKVGHSIFVATHKQLYEYFPSDMENVKIPGIVGGGFLVFYRTEKVFKNIFLFWVLCALDVKCIEPTKALGCNGKKMQLGQWADCHRYDQSTISILLGNQYNYNTSVYRDCMAKGDGGDFVTVQRSASGHKPLKKCKS